MYKTEYKWTGVISFVRCSKCGTVTEEFPSSNKARHAVALRGWFRDGRTFICPKCCRAMNIAEEKS